MEKDSDVATYVKAYWKDKVFPLQSKMSSFKEFWGKDTSQRCV